MSGSAVNFPGDKDLVVDLYRRLVSPKVEMKDLQGFMSTLYPVCVAHATACRPIGSWG